LENRGRREGNIKIDLPEETWGGLISLRIGAAGGRLCAVMNFRVAYYAGNFRLAQELVASQEGLHYMELVR
jgi:hypothetical protein